MWREAVEQCANMMAMDPYPGFEGKFFSMPVPQRRAEAGAEAASAAVGGLLQPRDHQAGGAARHRRADLRLRRSGRGEAVGRRLLPHLQGGVRADRPRGEPQHRHGDRLLAATTTRRRRAAAASTASASSAMRSAITTSSASTSPGRTDIWSQVRGGAARAAAGRRRARHRHAGRAARRICAASRRPASTRSSSSSRAAATSTSTSARRSSCSRAR